MSPLAGGRCPRGCAPPAEEAPHILPPGTLLNGRYLVGRSLGQGGFGITYIGRDKTLDIRVAIKEYYPSALVTRNVTASQAVVVTGRDKELLSWERAKFLEEARILARFIGEPGIVDVRDYFQANNTAYIVMEYLDGETLQEHLQRRGRLSPEETLALMTPVMRSLEKVHQSGLIHRDISPDNIMLLHGGGVKLLDFGTARSVIRSKERSMAVILKAGYAPEEQYRSGGNQGPWTDIYALCATMYRCITGIVPEDSLQRLYEDTVQPPSRLGIPIPPAWEAALMAGMACRMQDRPQTIGALAFALGLDGFAPPPPPKAQPRVVSGPTERIAPPSDPVRATQALFHEQQEPVPRPVPPPQPSLRTPPQQPVHIPPQAGTKKRPLPLAAVLGGGAALLAIIFAAVWVLRSGGGDSGVRAGTPAKENSSDSSADAEVPADVIQLGEIVTLEGYIIDNDKNDEYREKLDSYKEQYGPHVSMDPDAIRFENVINLRTDQGGVDQIQEANFYGESYDELTKLVDCKVEVTGRFEHLDGADTEELTAYQKEDGTTSYTYWPNGDYQFCVYSYTLLEMSASAEPVSEPSGSVSEPSGPASDPSESAAEPSKPSGPSGSAAEPSGPSEPAEPAVEPAPADNPGSEVLQYPTLRDYSAPLTRLGACQLLASYLSLPLDPDPQLTFTDCQSLSRQDQAVIAAAMSYGLMTGTSPTTFSPTSTLSLAQAASILWRYCGSPGPDTAGISFSNIDPDSWYFNSFAWLANMGAIPADFSGDPNQIITGEDLDSLLSAIL